MGKGAWILLLDEKEADFYNLEWYPGEAENMEYHNPTNVVDTSRVLFDQKTRVMGSHESRTKYLKLMVMVRNFTTLILLVLLIMPVIGQDTLLPRVLFIRGGQGTGGFLEGWGMTNSAALTTTAQPIRIMDRDNLLIFSKMMVLYLNKKLKVRNPIILLLT